MAIQNARILIRRGNEVDFDANNMQPGEWALSTDEKIVRICVAPGVCIRMATYDAFETDIAKIEAILEQAKSIKEAVTLINTEVSENAKAVAEYTEQAKQYRDEAEQFRNEAETFTPEGYSELVQNVEENTVKIETILEKGGLTFDSSASGEDIHLTDSTDNNVKAFALYGKATQNTTTGKQLLDLKNNTPYVGAVISYENEGEIITVKGTAPHCHAKYILPTGKFAGKTITFKAKKITKSNSSVKTFVGLSISKASDSVVTHQKITSSSLSNTVSIPSDVTKLEFHIKPNDSNTTLSTESILTVEELMVSENKDDTWEPYTNGASPNTDYPQEINIAGSDGSVEVVSCGKNLANPNEFVIGGFNSGTGAEIEKNDRVRTGFIKLKNSSFKESYQYETFVNMGTYYYDSDKNFIQLSGTVSKYSYIRKLFRNSDNTEITEEQFKKFKDTYIVVNSDETIDYEPYKETTSTIPTPNGLPGIPVSSGGNYTDENGQQWISDEIVKYGDGSGAFIQRTEKVEDVYTKPLAVPNINEKGVVAQFDVGNIIRKEMYCTHFPNSKVKNWNLFDNSVTNGGNPLKYIQFALSSDIATDKASTQTFFSNNKVSVLYALETPITTPLTAEEIAEIEKLQTFYPVTNISNDADCGMAVTYMADAKNYIDNIILSRVATLETAVINNL